MKELYAGTGKTFKQSEARPRKINQNSYKQNREDLGTTKRADKTLHAMPSHFCVWHGGGRKGKIQIRELKEEWSSLDWAISRGELVMSMT